MDLVFETQVKEKVLICRVRGEIDLYNARNLKDRVNEFLDDHDDNRNLVLDIMNVKYIDSTGLGILIGIKRRITENGGNLALVLNEERIIQLFSITGLSNIFSIVSSVEEAEKTLGS